MRVIEFATRTAAADFGSLCDKLLGLPALGRFLDGTPAPLGVGETLRWGDVLTDGAGFAVVVEPALQDAAADPARRSRLASGERTAMDAALAAAAESAKTWEPA